MTTSDHTNITIVKISETDSRFTSTETSAETPTETSSNTVKSNISASMSVETIQSSSDESMSGDEILSDFIDVQTNPDLPTGILFDINSKDKTIFKKDCMFKFIHDNPTASEIPDDYLNTYITEYNYNGQTPLMYAVILNNVNLVKALLKFDVGKMDEFNKSALDYANEIYHNLITSNDDKNIIPQLHSINHIINILSEYEYH